MGKGYTPGPWKVYFPEDKISPQYAVHAPIQSLSSTLGNGIFSIADVKANPNRDANARLIAAAPRTLEALKDAVSLMEAHEDKDVFGPANLNGYREAIAMATGEEV